MPDSPRLLNVRFRMPPGAGRALWNLVGGQIHIYDSQSVHLHSVPLTTSDQEHLDAGGRIVVAHACGTEVHIRLPHFG